MPFNPLHRLELGPGDDSGQPDPTFRSSGNVVDGGPGNDQLEGAGGGETLIGGPGDDTRTGDGGRPLPRRRPPARRPAAGPR